MRVTGGPLSPQPIATPSPPKAPPTPTTTTTATTSGPTPDLAAKLSDLDLICVVDDATECATASRAKAGPEMVSLLSDEELDKEDTDQEEEQLVRRAGGVA